MDTGDLQSNTSENFSFNSLEAIRRRLLDLTSRNNLLNYRHPKVSCIRLIDEQPDQIFDLLSNGDKFTFIPVPEPTHAELLEAGHIRFDTNLQKTITDYPSADQWAKRIGLAVSYELPTSSSTHDYRHADSNLQTLLYETDLESRLRKIRGAAETSLEESGSNILYLALGFLEWYESKESEVPRLAPLFTIPVSLERVDLKAGAYRYRIELKDDNLITNITLREKLANDFGYSLPEITDETTPEAYFDEIDQKLIRLQPKWKVRRFASLVMLNFTKQVMYEDLDPANWPPHLKIQDHPIIQKFFSDESGEPDSEMNGTGSPIFHEEEHQIDHIDDVHNIYPLIYDADSSQHSSVIDAVNGHNLVIEGPPGTGKSQTITNLIASSIANGKSVLFVAEKMAALNVVKNRLDNADLGDFCLELHSHKTNKQKILHDLDSRLKNQNSFTSPHDIDADISRYEDLKERLNFYVKEINTQWGNTSLTIHQILHRATRLREELCLNPEKFPIDNIDADNLTPLKQNLIIDQVKMLGSIYDQVSEQTKDGKIESHYWYGVEKSTISSIDTEEIERSLKAWNDSLVHLRKAWTDNLLELSFATQDPACLSSIYDFKIGVEKLPILIGGEQLDKSDYLYENHDSIDKWLEQYQGIHKQYDSIFPLINANYITNNEIPDVLESTYNQLIELGVSRTKKITEIAFDHNKLTKLTESISKLKNTLLEIQQNAPSNIYSLFDTNLEAFEELNKFVNLIQKLPLDLWKYRDDVFDNPELDTVLDSIEPELLSLEPLYQKVKSDFKIDGLPDTPTLRYYETVLQNQSIFKWLSSDFRNARKSFLALASTEKVNKKAFLQATSDVLKFSEQFDKVKLIHKNNPVLGELFTGPETPIARISKLRSWYKSIREEYGIGFGKRVQTGSSLIGLDRQFAMALVDEANKNIISVVQGAKELLQQLSAEYKNHPIFKDKTINLFGEESQLSKLEFALSEIIDAIKPISVNDDFNVGDVSLAQFKLRDVQKSISEWASSQHLEIIKPINQYFNFEPKSYSPQAVEVARNSLAVATAINENPIINSIIKNEPTEYSYQTLLNTLNSLNLHIDSVIESEKKFSTLAEANVKNWLSKSDDHIDSILSRNLEALTNISWLNVWVEYNQVKIKLNANGLSTIVRQLEAFEIKPEKLEKVVLMSIFYQLAKEVINSKPSLSSFAGIEQSAIQQRFKEYDLRLIGLQRKKVAYLSSRKNPAQGISSGRVSQLTELSLINQEISKKKRHIAVRSLLKRAGDAIKTLKPCFMMSPMSVAQYLEPGKFIFDLVIMDEASQIRPEDAIGAIARGTKLVVVGDPKQLPPTSFFSTTDDGDGDGNEDAVTLQVTESILETVSAMPVFKKRILKWHYRSRHESLIAFSNKHFYDSKLIVFPSPFKDSNEYGVKLHFIPKGRFAETGTENSGRNVEEASEVVKAIAKHLINNPKESLGVVAMNSKQKDEIEKQLDFLAKDDPILYQAIEFNKGLVEPLFIKNLENVQGDERDIIFISMTYGPNQTHGKVMQRFGPINQDVGWRRLNVLFTRSKKRMHIFSSMRSGDILNGSNSSRGVIALKHFLEYAETGHLYHSTITSKDADSDFEIAVMNELQKHGYECEPQLGVAGFYIDLAVKDPGKPGKFILGIECDGATYHSAKSARDRDRLRQEILEGLGWNIKRIWSTDWFKHPQSQLQPILNELKKLRTEMEVQADEIVVEVFEPIQETEQDELVADLAGDKNLTLTERLELFEQNVISQEFPKTDPTKKLLRKEMIEQLVEKLPTSKAEFQEFIPRFMRTETINYEAKFLDDVLRIVAEYY